MTALGIQIGWLAVRVTLVALLTLVFVAWFARRSARSTVVVLAGAIVIFLSQAVAALVPLPDSCRWSLLACAELAARPTVADENGAAQPLDAATEPGAGLAVGKAWAWLGRLGERVPQSPAWQSGWIILTAVYGLGVVFAGGRLLAGWLAIRALRRRGEPITDPELLRLADSLRQVLHSTQPVELRASKEPGLIATIGWWHAFVFLPPEWGSWTAAERQAVLAHELAHIRHRDYLIGLLTRCCQVLYFYHPLVWWLSAQLRWQQEVAADTLAAAAAGDREGYWKALARLALRTPARMPAGALGWSAMSGGALLRRINMLRGTGERRAMSWPTRGAIVGLLALTAALVSSVGSTANPPAPSAPAEKPESFELGYVTREAKGFVAIRPAVWFKQPGMEKVSVRIDTRLLPELKKIGVSWPAALRPENIDQIVADLHFSSSGTGKPGSRSMMFGASSVLIRLHEEFDWPAFLANLSLEIKKISDQGDWKKPFEDLKRIDQDGLTFYRLGIIPILGPTSVYVYNPDRRTAIFSIDVGSKSNSSDKETVERFAKLIRQAPAARQRNWGNGLKQMACAPFACVMDNSDLHYLRLFAKDVEKKDLAVLEAIRFLALGIELGDGRPVHLVVDAQSAALAPLVEKAVDEYVQRMIQLARDDAKSAEESVDKVMLKLAGELLESRQLERHESSFQWQAHSSVRVKDLVEALQKDEKRPGSEAPGK